MNTGNAIKIFGAGGLKVTCAVPEKHIINFFWPYKINLYGYVWSQALVIFQLKILLNEDQKKFPLFLREKHN